MFLTKKCSQGVVCPCPWTIYIYMTIISNISSESTVPNAMKAKFYLEPLLEEEKKVCLNFQVFCSCVGLYTCGKTWKTCIKSDFKEIVLKLATNWQSDKGFLLTSTFVPKGLSAPALGLYTCIKALKYISEPGVRWAFTGPLVLRLWRTIENYPLTIFKYPSYLFHWINSAVVTGAHFRSLVPESQVLLADGQVFFLLIFNFCPFCIYFIDSDSSNLQEL